MASKAIESDGVLPVIPLSPIIQSYITCSNALNLATEKLAEAKKAKPPVQVGVLRGLMDTFKIESQRLATITRKMQTVEAATAIFWDADALARQMAVIDSDLFSQVLIEKRSLLSWDESTKRFLDFHHYTTHSVAHQLIYWGELLNNSVAASAVVPTVNPNKDSLVSHFIRVAYLLLHAYRDYSGFAAIMKALTFPEVRRLKKLWQNTNSRTKDMFRELVQIISPTKNYYAYHHSLRTKLESHVNKSTLLNHKKSGNDVMVAIPWIQPHLLSIRSIIEAYTAGDNDQLQGNHYHSSAADVILSTPGANKLDIEIAVLELCQHQSSNSDFSFEEILSGNGVYDIKITATSNSQKRASQIIKPIHLDGLREAVLPVSNLHLLAPGEQLVHHWLVSRVYLRKDQLINESMEVEPLKPGERIACETDDFEEALFSVKPPPPVSTLLLSSSTTSKRNSLSSNSPVTETSKDEEQYVEQELQDMSSQSKQGEDAVVPTIIDEETPAHVDNPPVDENDSSDDDEEGGDNQQDKAETVEQELVDMKKEEEEEEDKPVTTTNKSFSVKSNTSSKSKSKLSASAPVFIPGSYKQTSSGFPQASSIATSEEKWTGYPAEEEEATSEKWGGYPDPVQEEDEEDEVWTGYPGPISFSNSPRRASSQSETSEEWKGYQATKMEADWQRESELKVQQHEWQGYTLETLDEDELDSSTMMNGEFEKSRKTRR